jgi:hypothetical protein
VVCDVCVAGAAATCSSLLVTFWRLQGPQRCTRCSTSATSILITSSPGRGCTPPTTMVRSCCCLGYFKLAPTRSVCPWALIGTLSSSVRTRSSQRECVRVWHCVAVVDQPTRAGEPDRSSPSNPSACLVVAEGITYPQLLLGLGTGGGNCRASHFGFQNDDPDDAWVDNAWISYSASAKASTCLGHHHLTPAPSTPWGLATVCPSRGRTWCETWAGRAA